MLRWVMKRRWETRSEAVIDDLAQRDLAAQEVMASMSRKSLVLSQWQLGISALTVAGLIVSLSFTAMSMRQTRQAMDIARTGMSVELAPYLTQTKYDVIAFAGRPTIRIDIANTGATAALRPRWSAQVFVVPIDPNLNVPLPMKPRSEWNWNHVPEIGPDGQTQFSLSINFEQGAFERVLKSELAVAVNYVIEFDDQFGNSHRLRHADLYWGEDLKGFAVNKAYFGPHSPGESARAD